MRTSNPALNDTVFDLERSATGDQMTINGTVSKTSILLALVMCTAIWSWGRAYCAESISELYPWLIGSGIISFIVGLITVLKKTMAPVTAPIYAGVEGVFLGIISAYYEMQFPGLVFQAILLTFGTLFALLFAYRSGFIKATENFKLGIVAATGGIFLIYLVTFVLGFFGISIPYIHGSGTIGIAFSLFVVVIAALNLVLDFDYIESGVDRGAPKYLEWYAAFGLLVTLIWLYIEILRLLAKLRNR